MDKKSPSVAQNTYLPMPQQSTAKAKIVKLAATIVWSAMASACQTESAINSPLESAFESPALLLVNPLNRNTVQTAIKAMLDMPAITIADTVFNESNQLILERKILLTREMSHSIHHFELLTANKERSSSCILRHKESGQRLKLKGLCCIPQIK